MRYVIVGLSVIFFSLSAIILFKALNLPVNQAEQQNKVDGLKSPEPATAAENTTGEPRPDQADDNSILPDLKAVSEEPEDKGADKVGDAQKNDMTSGTGRGARVLAVIGDGDFDSGQILMDYGLMKTIKDVVPDILSSPHYRVYVEGHTDDMPIKASSDKQYVDNMELSLLRAKAVASILMDNGISPDRISVAGYGETRPIASNETDEGKIKNRRVEIKLVPEDKEL
ncbi:MAG: OmpA family protein [Nitrospirae bacterium]|nr:OmpA family protein [Nitrospirota bacterium]